MKKGFTLIELLVVILIIGILAAVAVPQYNRTVAKTRAAEALSKINVLYQALERYKLAAGSYPALDPAPTLSQMNQVLDVDLNLSSEFANFNYYPHAYVAIRYNKNGCTYYIAKGLSTSTSVTMHKKGNTGCWAYDSNPRGQEVCRSICGDLFPSEDTASAKVCLIK
ncbi:hypothetical protein FACS189437_03910 [Bacteroidia bacterium]|nr:hypothetical protein FACS189437_03910 [Bacteroidia bacterium]